MIDRRGVLGFPMRLAVAALIIALFIPSAISAAEYFTESSEVAEVRHTADSVVSAAADAWYSGKGSTREVAVSVPGGYSIAFGGDSADRYSYSILKGDEVVGKVYLESPRICFLEGSATVSGYCVLHIVCTSDADCGYGIRVSTV